jgi:hypothetical protein
MLGSFLYSGKNGSQGWQWGGEKSSKWETLWRGHLCLAVTISPSLLPQWFQGEKTSASGVNISVEYEPANLLCTFLLPLLHPWLCYYILLITWCFHQKNIQKSKNWDLWKSCHLLNPTCDLRQMNLWKKNYIILTIYFVLIHQCSRLLKMWQIESVFNTSKHNI